MVFKSARYRREKICDSRYKSYIKNDGTVNFFGSAYREELERNEDDWSDIELLANGLYHAVALRADGTWVTAGEYSDGQRDVDSWEDIVSISVGIKHTVGLKSDGTVVATGDNRYGQCKVSSWKDIIKISAGDYSTFGLKSDGTVVATGKNKDGECEVQEWKNVIDIASTEDGAFGLTADGEVLTTSRDFTKAEYMRTIPYKYCVKDATGIRSNGGLLLITKQDGTIELFGEEYYRDAISGVYDLACSKLMDIFNNSLLNVTTPSYPSALNLKHLDDITKVSDAPNPQSDAIEAKQEYSESKCKEIALAYMRENIRPYLKNPSSLQIIDISGSKTGTEYLFTISYTAMNSFGGYTPGTYYCKVDCMSGKVTMGGII